MKVDPPLPQSKLATSRRAPSVARLTRLPVDFDVEVALRPVLRPHSDRGGSKSWEMGRKAVRRAGGARASVTSRRPVATAPEAETGPSHLRPPGSHGVRTTAAALFTWLASSLRPPQ